MEADIIVEGFKLSMDMHKVKYLKFIADGDSSVFYKIREKVPYGHEVTKIECVNHAIKNYGKALYKIKSDTAVNVEGRKLLTVDLIKKMEKVAMKVIYVNACGDIEKLKIDLSNGPNHSLNDHSKCEPHYCDDVGNDSKSRVPLAISTGILIHINSS